MSVVPTCGCCVRLYITPAQWSDSEYGMVFIQFGGIVVFDETVNHTESSEDVEGLMATLHGFERVLPTWCWYSCCMFHREMVCHRLATYRWCLRSLLHCIKSQCSTMKKVTVQSSMSQVDRKAHSTTLF